MQVISTFVKGVSEATKNPFQFEPSHTAIREPFDYYTW
jgi:hypothetical protein